MAIIISQFLYYFSTKLRIFTNFGAGRDKTRIRMADTDADEKIWMEDKTRMRKCGWRIKGG